MTTTEGVAAEDDDIPKFDLGISLVKETLQHPVPIPQQPSSTSCIEKGKHVMQEAKPEPKNDLRRQPELGDHLLSPFITRCLDLNENAVDKRVT